MIYRVIIEQQEIGGAWKRIHEEISEVVVHEKAARQIERIIKEAGLDIDPRDLRDILAEELGEKE